MSIIKTDSNQLLRELWHIFTLQHMFGGDALSYTADLSIEFIATTNDIENSGYELGRVLEEMYYINPHKAPVIAELLSACKLHGILKKEE